MYFVRLIGFLQMIADQPRAGGRKKFAFVVLSDCPVCMKEKWKKFALHRTWALIGLLQIPVPKPIQKQCFWQTKNIPEPANVTLNQMLTRCLIIEPFISSALIGVKFNQGIEESNCFFRLNERSKPAAKCGRESRQPLGLKRHRVKQRNLRKIRERIPYPGDIQIRINHVRVEFDQLPDKKYLSPRDFRERSRSEVRIFLHRGFIFREHLI